MKNITVRCGSQSHTKSFEDDATIGQVVKNATMKAVLQHGDNVRAVICGVEQDANTIAPAGCEISVETRCNEKQS